MTTPALVLLHGVRDTPAAWAGVAARLAGRFAVLAPPVGGPAAGADKAYDLELAAESVARALPAGAGRLHVCGVGLGALVAMTLAAAEPQRVAGLALVTRAVAPSPLLLSLPAAVVRLLPADRLQRLGMADEQVVALLDQVRPVDVAALAPRVAAPATVLVGARDRVNAHASRTLARSLPAGALVPVPGAGPSWWSTAPELLATALTETFLPH